MSNAHRWGERDGVAVATFPDGSQILVTTWASGVVEVARRAHSGDVWGPPQKVESQ